MPGDHALARKVTREANEYASALKRDQPEHFGYWASLLLPDVEGSLAELQHACDHLEPDGNVSDIQINEALSDGEFSTGITLHTNAHGNYLGHPDFEPLFEELNRRKTIVFIHPTTPCMLSPNSNKHASSEGSQTISPLSQYPAPMMEFLFDTSRAVINLFFSGTISRYPDITYIVPHCGGTLAPLIDRFSVFGSLISGSGVDPSITPQFVRERLQSKQFYFDMAGLAWPNQCKMIMPYITPAQLLYGSDFPYTPLDKVEMLANIMDDSIPATFDSESDREAIYQRNAADLLKARGWGQK